MKRRCLTCLICLSILLPPTISNADPILKPRKYHGPIPQRYYGINIGFLGGPSNTQMWDYLERQIDQPLRRFLNTDDFGASFAVDVIYGAKVHPQFGVRLKGGVAFLTSGSDGLVIPSDVDTLLNFDRSFDILLSSLEATAMFYFQDASVDEFQSYIGGGFSFYFPYARYKEDLKGNPGGEAYSSSETTKFSAEPGVHAVLGALYHIRNDIAVQLEARGFLAQSKFEIDALTDSAGIQSLNFDVDYSGFVLVAGVSKFF